MSDSRTDLAVMNMLAEHFSDVDDLMYIGPNNGAHYPSFFATPKELPKKYEQLRLFAQVLRMTAGLYVAPVRQLSYAENVWCFGQDFDFDRNGWEGVAKSHQETALYQMCQELPPTFASQTRNGYHLFWVLERPEPVFGYAYPAGLIQKKLKADPHSVVPVHCLSAFATGSKHAHIVDCLDLTSIGKKVELFPHNFNIYTCEKIMEIVNPEPNPIIRNLRTILQNAQWTGAKSGENRENFVDKGYIESLVERYDIVGLLRRSGNQAYARGNKKIIMCCPYHNDRHPSSFLNLDPASEFYGLFSCVSCGKKAMLPTLLRDIGVVL